MPDAIDFWFDFSCPYAYLASTQRRRLAEEAGVPVRNRPFLLGGVFRALGQAQNLSTTLSPAKARHNRLDVVRWAAWFDVPLRTPYQHPNRTVEALRALLATPAAHQDAVIDAFYRAYWVDGANLADVAVLRERLGDLGLDAETILTLSETPEIKDELRRRTDEAVSLGIFGAPTFVVGDQLFWGQDRLPFVVRAAQGWDPEAGRHDFRF